ncbi:MAG TPA: GGDEF domain-containing protein [Anaeromyxobacteraceae bacterium]
MGELMGRLSRGGSLVTSIGLMAVVAVGDFLTGPELDFAPLYLLPVGIGTWFAGLRFGVVLTVTSALLAMGADVSARHAALALHVRAWNLVVQAGSFATLAVILAALRQRLENEQRLARTDPLTLVANRRAFEEAAAVELERSRRTGRPLTVAYVDVDDFKLVNDAQGHARGDAFLVTTAATLRGATRAVDVVARLGGDEFGLLLVDTDAATAEPLLQRLRTTLGATLGQNGWTATFSIGAACFTQPARSVDEMMGRADQLMYDAKRAGKDRVCLDVLPHPSAAAARA